MAGRKLKALTYRVEGVPPGTNELTLIRDHFHEEDQQRLVVKSLCPSVDETDELTATVLFHPPEVREGGPRYHGQHITVDRDFNGFTPLYVPKDKRHIKADIIAISGLAGHAFGSWAHSDEGMWLRDYLPRYADNARIMTYGYASELQNTSSFGVLQDYSRTFLHKLIVMRKFAKCNDRPLIFVGHSLGCLLIKKALTDAGQIGMNDSRLPVHAILFLAAPHQGLNTTAIRALIKGQPCEGLVRELEPGSSLLNDMNSRFIHIANKFPIWSFYETRLTKSVVMGVNGEWARDGPAEIMVTRDSAQLCSPYEQCFGADSDHSGIAKLKRGQGGIFADICFAIRNSLYPNAPSSGTAPPETDELKILPSGSSRLATLLPRRISPPLPSQKSAQSPFCEPLAKEDVAPLSQTTEWPESQHEKVGIDLSNPTTCGTVNQDVTTDKIESTLSASGELAQAQDPASDRNITPRRPSPEALSLNLARHPEPEAGAETFILKLPSCECCSITIPRSTLYWRCQYHPQTGKKNYCQSCPDEGIAYCSKHEQKLMKVCLEPSPHPYYALPYVDPNISESDDTIVRAIKLNNVDELKRLAETNEALLKAANTEYCTPLHLAVRLGRADCARVLLAQGALKEELQESIAKGALKEELQEPTDRTPLRDAIRYGHVEVVRLLLDYGANINAINKPNDKRFASALGYAAYTGKSNMVALLLKYHAASDLLDTDSRTALHLAASTGICRSASLLLDAGANVNAEDNHGDTPLHIAVAKGHLEMVALLLEHHAAPDLPNTNSETALHIAACKRDERSASRLLDADADPNAENEYGNTPLHLAAARDHLKMIKALLSSSAALDGRNKKYETPLHRAVIFKQAKATETLLGAGANPDLPADNGDTPLHTAARKGFTKIVDVLGRHNASVASVNKYLLTPLLVAVEKKKTETCRSLLDAKSDVDSTRSSDGTAALMIACSKQDYKTLELLLEYGATIDQTNKDGHTCLYLSVRKGDLGVCEYLLDHGASPNKETRHGKNSVALAAEHGHIDILKSLLRKGGQGTPPSRLKGKWRNLGFKPGVSVASEEAILRLLREAKHK